MWSLCYICMLLPLKQLMKTRNLISTMNIFETHSCHLPLDIFSVGNLSFTDGDLKTLKLEGLAGLSMICTKHQDRIMFLRTERSATVLQRSSFLIVNIESRTGRIGEDESTLGEG